MEPTTPRPLPSQTCTLLLLASKKKKKKKKKERKKEKKRKKKEKKGWWWWCNNDCLGSADIAHLSRENRNAFIIRSIDYKYIHVES